MTLSLAILILAYTLVVVPYSGQRLINNASLNYFQKMFFGVCAHAAVAIVVLVCSTLIWAVIDIIQ